jgi:hypothetical protein
MKALQKRIKVLILLIAFAILFQASSAQTISTIAPTWVSSDYFRANQYRIVNAYPNTLTPTNPPATYTFTFSHTFNNTPKVAYGIQEYRGKDTFY